jgi:hypothetical protein
MSWMARLKRVSDIYLSQSPNRRARSRVIGEVTAVNVPRAPGLLAPHSGAAPCYPPGGTDSRKLS